MTRWYLEGCLDETQKSRKTPLNKFPFRIGRSKKINMVVLRTGISRQHAEIYKKDGRLYIRDLGSTNGTYVDNKKIESDTELTHNCVINFAHVESRLVDTEYIETDNEPVTVVMTLEQMRIKLEQKAEATESENKANELDDKPSQKEIKQTKDTSENLESDLPPSLNNEDYNEPKTPVAKEQHEPASNPHSVRSQNAHLDHSNHNVFIQGRWDQSNRRKYNRREGHWHAHLTLKNNDVIDCTTKDVSEEGIAILSPLNLKESTLVKVEVDVFYNGRARKIISLGVVKHTTVAKEGFTLGILFKKATKESSEFLHNYANHLI